MKLPQSPIIAKLISVFILAGLLVVCSSAQSNAESIINDLIIKAEQGEVKAQTILGLKYAKGEGVSQDYKQAVYWLTKAAEQGDDTAQYSLGRMYFYGTGKPEDLFYEIFNKSTKIDELGYANIENDLAEINGEGVAQDYQQAIYWLTKAAEQGHAGAQNHLGRMYYEGEGVPQNFKKAVYWFTKAAEQENDSAQYKLAMMYAKGEGLPKNYSYAYSWFSLAVSQGYKDAIKPRDEAAAFLSQKQLAEAQELAIELQKKIDNPYMSLNKESSENYKKEGFSIKLPAGWIEIPRDKIDEFEKTIGTIDPDAPAEHFAYGFQLENSQNWFEYPYILIKIITSGRIPRNQLEKLDGYSAQKSIEKDNKNLSKVLKDIKVEQMVYDKQTKMIWMQMEFNVATVGPVSGISGSIPTENGLIQVLGYSLREDYSAYETLFKSVATSVIPEPGLAYKPKWSDNLSPIIANINWGKVIGKAIAGVILAGIVSGIYALIGALRKKKNGP
jgi:uncharacterized protein